MGIGVGVSNRIRVGVTVKVRDRFEFKGRNVFFTVGQAIFVFTGCSEIITELRLLQDRG